MYWRLGFDKFHCISKMKNMLIIVRMCIALGCVCGDSIQYMLMQYRGLKRDERKKNGSFEEDVQRLEKVLQRLKIVEHKPKVTCFRMKFHSWVEMYQRMGVEWIPRRQKFFKS